MSLVSQLLEGTLPGNTSNVDISMYDFSNEAVAESTYLDQASIQLCTDIMEASRLWAVADIVGGVKVITEGADPEAIMESANEGGFAKLKAAFSKFLAKIKAFFVKVKQYFKSIFLRGSKFVKEFKSQLLKKETNNFKITGYDYTISAGDAMIGKAQDAVAKRISSIIITGAKTGRVDEDIHFKGDNEKKGSIHGQDLGSMSHEASGDDFSHEKMIEDVCNSITADADDVTELRTEIAKAYRNDEDDKEEIEPFSKNSVGAMCDFIVGYDKKVREFDKSEKAFETYVKSIIKCIDDFAKKTSANEKINEDYKNASKVSSAAQALLNLYKSVCDMQVSAYKEISNAFEATLKSFLHWNPKKAATEGVDAPEMNEDTTEEADMPAPFNGDFDPDPNIAKVGKECSESASALFEAAQAILG